MTIHCLPAACPRLPDLASGGFCLSACLGDLSGTHRDLMAAYRSWTQHDAYLGFQDTVDGEAVHCCMAAIRCTWTENSRSDCVVGSG
jgi:hypothetical protein